MQSSAVEDRLKSQRAKYIVHTRRIELLQREANREAEEAKRNEDNSETEFLRELLNRGVEPDPLDDISIASFYTNDSDHSDEKQVDKERETADKMLAALQAQRDETVTLESYVNSVCNRKDSEWDSSKIQTAKILIELENPRRVAPNARVLIQNVLAGEGPSGEAFTVGSWAEYRGPDTNWHLDIVHKIIPVDVNGRKEILYNVGSRRRLRRYEIRKPQEGLTRIFGYRPWIWQQWALLKVEQQLRFQAGNHHDFERFNIPLYARDLWFEWLNSPKNKDFKDYMLDHRIKLCQDDLFDHIMKPFYFLDDIRRGDGWDFNNDEVSVFTYWALFGTGATICFISIILQFTIPLVLLMNTLREKLYNINDENDPFDNLQILFCVSDDAANCTNLRNTAMIIVCVQVLYLIKVYPDSQITFRNVIGIGGYGRVHSYARIKSLRQIVSSRNNDRIGQAFGNIWDFYMNTLYVYFLYMLNIFNILNQASPTDVVLNALALEFVYKIDEEYAKSVWWDPNRRWLKAGTLEVAMQSFLRFRYLTSARLFADKFKITEEEILLACDDDPSLLYDDALSRNDRKDIANKDDSELFEHFCMEKSHKDSLNKEVRNEFTKMSTVFGKLEQKLFIFIDKLTSFLGFNPFEELCVFNRHIGFRTWSRWEKILYLAKVPKLDDLFELNCDDIPIIKKIFEKVKHTKKKPFFNFSTESRIDIQQSLKIRQFEVLSFQALRNNLRKALYERDYDRFIFWCINGIFEWLAYVVQFAFPLYNISLLVLFYFCMADISTKSSEDSRCDCRLQTLIECADKDPPCTYVDKVIRSNGFDLGKAISEIVIMIPACK